MHFAVRDIYQSIVRLITTKDMGNLVGGIGAHLGIESLALSAWVFRGFTMIFEGLLEYVAM